MWVERSAPASCISSSAAAESPLGLEGRCFFFIACSPDGDDPNAVAPHGDERRPYLIADSPDDLRPSLIERSGLNLETVGIAPEGLRDDEVDAVLLQVGRRLRRVEPDVHQV